MAARYADQPLRRPGLPAALLALALLAGACSASSLPVGGAAPAGPSAEEAAAETAEKSPTPSPTTTPRDDAVRAAESPSDREDAAPSAQPREETSATEPDPEPSPTASAEPSAEPAAPEVEAGLAPGDEGESVRLLQQRLTDLAYKPIGVDGVFGADTQRAIEVFQHDHDLAVTGRVTPATVEALQAATPVALIGPGADGPDVAELQQLLNDGPFDAGPVDGQYGTKTQLAVYALQKLHGYPADGVVTPVERYLLETDPTLPPQFGGSTGTHVEVDLGRQLTSVHRDGQLILAIHSSSGNNETFCTPAGGCRRAVTPTGDYTITRRIAGWRTSELGRLYNPLYFNGGIAFHGAYSVPTHPASHGCVRLPMWVAEYLPEMLPNGTRVLVR